MKKIFVLFVLMGVALSAHAQTVENDLIGLGMKPEVAEYLSSILPGGSVLGNDTYLKGRNQANSADVSVLKVNATDDTVINADSGDVIKFSVANTPIAALGDLDANGFALMKVVGDSTLGGNSVYASGKGPKFAKYVPTMAATPADGTNMLSGVLNIVPTAAANTAALFESTPVAGVEKIVCNDGPNAVRVKAGGASTINGSAAGAYIPLATQACVRCLNSDGTNWNCGSYAVPTPAGP